MKKIIYIFSLLVAVMLTYGCDDRNSLHEGIGPGQGILVFTLNTEQMEEADDISIWVFNEEGVLAESVVCSDFIELANKSINVAIGKYDVVAVINSNKGFTIEYEKGVTTTATLKAMLNSGSDISRRFQSGKTSVTVNSERITLARVSLNVINASLTVSVSEILENVAAISYKVQNCASGYYPASDLFTTESYVKQVNQADNTENKVQFPEMLFMPVANGDDFTSIRFDVIYKSGKTETYSALAPAMKKGKSYTIDIPFSSFENDVIIEIEDIDGWQVVEKDGGSVGETISE